MSMDQHGSSKVSKVSTTPQTPPHTGCITTTPSPRTSRVTTTTSLCQPRHHHPFLLVPATSPPPPPPCASHVITEGRSNNDKGNGSHGDKGDNEVGIEQQKLRQLRQQRQR
jgi:hypothetical protein